MKKSIPLRYKSVNTRILLADDNQPFRSSMKNLLAGQNPTWEISEAANAEETQQRIAELHPNVVVLDLNLPDAPGLESVQQIRRISPGTKIISCSVSESTQLAVLAKHVGADGYISKDRVVEDSQRTITSVLNH